MVTSCCAGSDDEEHVSLAERASIAEGARQRAAGAATAGPAMQQAIHTELRGAHAPLPTAQAPARQQQQQQQQQQPSSRQPAEAERVSAAHDLPRGGSPTSKVRASRRSFPRFAGLLCSAITYHAMPMLAVIQLC